jgi:hypothetical protein
MSPLKAIASPQILISWQPKKQSGFKQKYISTTPVMMNRAETAQSPDFKIKKMVGADSFREQALHNSRHSQSSRTESELASYES